jgi:hypothetical protein
VPLQFGVPAEVDEVLAGIEEHATQAELRAGVLE